MKTPGINGTIFTVEFGGIYSRRIVILENPYKKWYKKVFQFVTFGIYKATYQYKCKIIE